MKLAEKQLNELGQALLDQYNEQLIWLADHLIEAEEMPDEIRVQIVCDRFDDASEMEGTRHTSPGE